MTTQEEHALREEDMKGLRNALSAMCFTWAMVARTAGYSERFVEASLLGRFPCHAANRLTKRLWTAIESLGINVPASLKQRPYAPS